MPGWLEDGRQGARALHVTHDRMARLPKVRRLLTGTAGRGLDGTAGIRPRHGGVARRRLGRRPFRRIHPPTRPCLRRSNGHAGQTDMSHARERVGHRGGRGGCGRGRSARDRRQVRRAPLPSSLCSLSTSPRRPPLPAFPSSPSSSSSPPFPSSPLSLECRLLAPEPHCHRRERSWRWRCAPPCGPLPSLPASVCAPSAAPSVLPSVLSVCLCVHPHSSSDSAVGAWDWGGFSPPQNALHVIAGRYEVRRPPPSSLYSLSSSPRRPPLPAFHSSPSSLSSPPFLSSPLSLQCPLACCRAASPCAHLQMEAHTAMQPAALFSPRRSVPRLQPPLCCRPCLPAASVPIRIPP